MQIRGASPLVVKPAGPRTLTAGIRYGSALPSGDTFEKRTPAPEAQPDTQAKPKSASQALKALLKDAPWAERKAGAAYFLEQAAGIKPMQAMKGIAEANQLTDAKKEDLKQLAEQIRTMNPVDKVNLVKQVTGPESPYSKVAETILVAQKFPGLGDVANLFKPDVQDKSFDGVSAAIQAVGVGLLMMPVVAPASVLFRPDLLGGLLAKVALWMI